jgi:hypothetical protein
VTPFVDPDRRPNDDGLDETQEEARDRQAMRINVTPFVDSNLEALLAEEEEIRTRVRPFEAPDKDQVRHCHVHSNDEPHVNPHRATPEWWLSETGAEYLIVKVEEF